MPHPLCPCERTDTLMKSLLLDAEKRRYYAPLAICLALIVLLLLAPTGFEGALQYQQADRCTALVTAVDDSAIIDTGLVRSGEQRCTQIGRASCRERV